MSRQNRVNPFGDLIATSARGTLMGNRGCLHDDNGRIRRHHVGVRWIICLLKFKDEQRSIMRPRSYTELFFLDEATALAAGHRPCSLCQRERFDQFRSLWARANPEASVIAGATALGLDKALRRETPVSETSTLDYAKAIEELPDGTFVTSDGKHAYLVYGGRILQWDSSGYSQPAPNEVGRSFRVLTPASIVRTLRAGYPVGIHHSAIDLSTENLNKAILPTDFPDEQCT